MELDDSKVSIDLGDISNKTEKYFSTGNQYYLVSRFGAFAGLIPVTGNLYHHAIEFFLKGYLCRVLSDKDLKDNYGHKLVNLWNHFKAEVNDPTLDQFDQCIAELDKFDFIRYPDEVLKHGMQASIRFTKDNPNANRTSPWPHLPAYELSVDELDELVLAVYAAASMNPEFISAQFIHHEEKEYLHKKNKSGLTRF